MLSVGEGGGGGEDMALSRMCTTDHFLHYLVTSPSCISSSFIIVAATAFLDKIKGNVDVGKDSLLEVVMFSRLEKFNGVADVDCAVCLG